tara:strand:- start:4105 stop:4422 length:318 start_codon:yes stop_codon:yes gene_type:complete
MQDNKKVISYSEFVKLNERKKSKVNNKPAVNPEEQFKNEYCTEEGSVVGVAISSSMSHVREKAMFNARKKIAATGHTGSTSIVQEKMFRQQDGKYKCMICLKKDA